MATRYSILSVLIRPEIQEKISIGLLLFNNDEVYYSYSKNKLQISKELLSNSSYKILQNIVESIKKEIDSNNSEYSHKRAFKIFKNSISDNVFSTSYISYLSKYSNNIISFASPKEIHTELSEKSFYTLFRQYVDDVDDIYVDDIIEIAEVLPKLKPVEYIRNRFGKEIKEYYDLDKAITHEQVQNLITPVRIDFAGRNEIDVFAQTVDMEAGSAAVANHINAFIQLITTYANNKIPVKDFFIAKEPAKESFPKQHDMWNQLRTSNMLNYLDLSDSETIITYAKQHGVVPITKSDG